MCRRAACAWSSTAARRHGTWPCHRRSRLATGEPYPGLPAIHARCPDNEGAGRGALLRTGVGEQGCRQGNGHFAPYGAQPNQVDLYQAGGEQQNGAGGMFAGFSISEQRGRNSGPLPAVATPATAGLIYWRPVGSLSTYWMQPHFLPWPPPVRAAALEYSLLFYFYLKSGNFNYIIRGVIINLWHGGIV